MSKGLFSIEFNRRVLKFSRSKAEEEISSGKLKSTGSSTTESSSSCTLPLSPKEAWLSLLQHKSSEILTWWESIKYSVSVYRVNVHIWMRECGDFLCDH